MNPSKVSPKMSLPDKWHGMDRKCKVFLTILHVSLIFEFKPKHYPSDRRHITLLISLLTGQTGNLRIHMHINSHPRPTPCTLLLVSPQSLFKPSSKPSMVHDQPQRGSHAKGSAPFVPPQITIVPSALSIRFLDDSTDSPPTGPQTDRCHRLNRFWIGRQFN